MFLKQAEVVVLEMCLDLSRLKFQDLEWQLDIRQHDKGLNGSGLTSSECQQTVHAPEEV